MTHVAWVNLYVCANVLIALALAWVAAIGALSGRLRCPIAYRHRLRIGHMLIMAAVLFPFGGLIVGKDDVLPKTAQVWSASTMNVDAGVSDDQRIAVFFAPLDASLPLSLASDVAAVWVSIGLLFSLARLGRDVYTTLRVIGRAPTIRRHGRLSIRASEEIQVPFSFWLPARYWIVVPSALVVDPMDLKMAMRHEAQHHRQHDTKWLYAYQLLRAFFFWNPAVHSLERHLRSLQEFACDAALNAHRSIVYSEYCRSLLRVAEAAAPPRPSCARASMLDGGAFLLKRRVEALLQRPAAHQRGSIVVATGAVAISMSALTSLAFGSTIHDRRVSGEQAARMAALARETAMVPIVVNDRVLRQLNLLLATPDGRAFLQASLRRMRSYETLLSGELEAQHLPRELLAVPLVESGYRNLEAGSDPRHGAGLWMFIEPTARRFGLAVNAAVDERLDVAAETRAAAKYFAELHRHFGDWGLAILAYNTGYRRVEEGIRATGSRDAWQLVAQGFENDPNYLPRVTAAILVMTNRSEAD